MTSIPPPPPPPHTPPPSLARECPAAAEPARIEGPLTVCTAETLRPRLLEGITTPTGMRLDLSAVDACDCAGLQLLVATRKSALAAGRSLQFTNLSAAILNAAQDIGLDVAEFAGLSQEPTR